MNPSRYPDGHPRRKQILLVLCLSLLIVVIDNTILNTALPTLAEVLHASTVDLQWITDSYTLVFGALLIVAGSLGDRFGRREALIGGLIVFAGGSTMAALSSSSEMLIAARAVMGIGGAFVMPATLSILAAVFPVRERAAAIGAWSAVAGIGIVIGPTLGGLLLDHFAWGAVFWINVPLVAVALIAITTVIPSMAGQKSGTRLDWIGAAFSAAALLAIIDAVIEGPERGWTSALTVAEVAAGLALLAAFVLWELRVTNPLIDVRVFKHRAFSAASSAVALTFFALFGALFALTQYLQLVVGYSPLGAGVRALPFAGAVLVTAPLSSLLVARLGIRAVIPVGLTLMSTGLFLLTQVDASTGYGYLAIAVSIMGAGMGLTIAPAGESIMTVLPPSQVGVGSAVNDTVQEVGGSLGVAVVGSYVSASYRNSIDSSSLPAAVRAPARESIGAADAVARHAGDLSGQVLTVSHDAFISAMTGGYLIAAIGAAVGAVVTVAFLPSRSAARRVLAAQEADQANGPADVLDGQLDQLAAAVQ
jgi:EmrB/QacA subfamily drug resistance transporter